MPTRNPRKMPFIAVRNAVNKHSGKEILKRIQMYLYLQVAGDRIESPIIPGGYYGPIYQQAFQTITTFITACELEENIAAIRAGVAVPHRRRWAS